jgi:hypothetical protein
MNKLTAEKCRHHIDRLSDGGEQRCLSIYEEDYLQALEIALPVLKGRIASSELPKEVFGRLYDQYLNGVICGEGNKSAAKDFLDACVIALYDSQPQPTSTPQIDNDGWIDWRGGDVPPVEGLVEVRWSDASKDTGNAHKFRWYHYKIISNIIAYRVIENDGREG